MDTRTFDAHGVTFSVSSPDADVVAVFMCYQNAREIFGAPLKASETP